MTASQWKQMMYKVVKLWTDTVPIGPENKPCRYVFCKLEDGTIVRISSTDKWDLSSSRSLKFDYNKVKTFPRPKSIWFAIVIVIFFF
jgi:hypothetical protein